jgi:acyl-CoA thioester hydrolase
MSFSMKTPSDSPSAEARLRVRYAETDQMGVVYYANYLVWMEVARMEWCRAFGIDYREMEREDGVALAVVEANCRYRSPARFDDEIAIVRRSGLRNRALELIFGHAVLLGLAL